MDIRETVLSELERVAETDQVRLDPQIRLFDEGVLDSFATIELMVALGQRFDLSISPAAFDRTLWATPEKIIADITRRIEEK
jgi:D-alanine--poly(phosphoribitol) ligase subunit 2